jgi:ferredoxin
MDDKGQIGGLLKNGASNYAGGLGRKGGGVLCHCCACCCNVLGAVIRSGTVHEQYSPSRFRPAADEELCTGCQECVDRCFFDAIEMRETASSKKLKASTINDKCMRCGPCVIGCEQKALTFELVRPPEHNPSEPSPPPAIQRMPIFVRFASAP